MRNSLISVCSRFGISLIAGLILLKVGMAAEPMIFQVASAQLNFDKRTGQPIVKIELKEKRPFTMPMAEQQVGRTMQFRVDGEVIMSARILEPLYAGVFELSGPVVQELRIRIEHATEVGSRLEVAILN